MNLRHPALSVASSLITLLVLMSVPTRAAAPGPQTNRIFWKLGGIAGGSTDEAHAGEIDVLSLNWSVNHTGAKVEPHDALILKSIDVATPRLMTACVSGEKISEAIITARGTPGTPGGKESEFLVYTFSDVVITVVSHTVINGAQEQVQFRYGSVKISYKSADGKTVEETWKVATPAAP